MKESEKYCFKEIKPDKLFQPQNATEISDIFKYSIKNNKKVIILGNNTQDYFGNYSEKVDIVISTLNLNKIIEYNINDFTITTEAGITLTELQKQVFEENQLLPIDPEWRENSTIGGIVAMNDSGSLQYGYGSCKDLILGMNYVLPDGIIAKTGGKTVKNVAGYDMSKLFIGSMGAFGAITNITWKLFPKLPVVKTFEISLEDLNSYAIFLEKLWNSKYTFSIVDIIYTDVMKLFIRIEGEQQYVDYSFTNLENDLSQFKNSKISEINKNYHEENYNLSQSEEQLNFKILLPVGKSLEMIKFLTDLCDEQNLPVSIISHVGNGVIKANCSLKDKKIELSNTINNIRKEIRKLNGRLIVTKLPINYKNEIDIWDATDSEIYLLQKIKQQLDPEGVIAKGRFIGGL